MPEDCRITASLDGGPRGAQNILCGASVPMPRRKPPGESPAREQIGHNSWPAGERAIIENSFAGIKDRNILGSRFRDAVHDIEEAGAAAAGRANLKRIRSGQGTRPSAWRTWTIPQGTS